MKKLFSIQTFLGLLLLLAGFSFSYLGSQSDNTLVDEFNIYWMFAISGIGLGGLLLTNENTGIASRVVLILSLIALILLYAFFEVGSAIYFIYVFLLTGIVLFFSKDLEGAKVATFVSRIFVGSLFVVSGLIKANDPRGFGYKLEEYFAPNSLGDFWAIFHDYALPLAILIASVEVVLGLAVLFGGKARLANWTLFAMALFFAWLTWYTASCNDSRDAFQADKTVKIEAIKTECGEFFDYIHDDLSQGYLEEEILAITTCKDKFEAVDTLNFERDCVNDCGCFGDALKGSIGRSLTPWESFYKDITLLFFVLVLLVRQSKIEINDLRMDLLLLPLSLVVVGAFSGGLFHWWFPLWFLLGAILVYLVLKRFYIAKIGQEWTIAIGCIILSVGFTYYCYYYLPIKDFRPYAIGKNIIEERTDIAPKLKFYYKLKDKKTGEEKEFEAFPENYDVNYDYVSSRTITLEPGKDAPARDFNITESTTNMDITDSVLAMDRVILVIAYNLSKPSASDWQAINNLAKEAQLNSIPIYILSSTVGKEREDVIKNHSLAAPVCASDEKVLKTIIRSNPGLLLIKKAVVQNKWPITSLPDSEFLITTALK